VVGDAEEAVDDAVIALPATEEEIAATAPDDTPAADDPTAPFTIPETPATPQGEAVPSRQRAHELLESLRALFDEQESALANRIEPAPVPNESTGNAAIALKTLKSAPSDGQRFDNLRAIVEKARERPRDVDTMLDLVGEIGSLIALMDSHEQYVQVVDTAIGQLENA
jgi:hypothetical protein